jgi:biopolymer transport protein ExbD
MSGTAPVQKASLVAVRREIYRRKRQNRIEHVAEELNVVPMMDMMTIILVFLLKSLSSSSANIPQGDDLRLPRSTIDTSPSNALQVIISRVSISVNGRFIAGLQNGLVDPSLIRGGATGLLINPLSEHMREQVQVAQAIAQRAGQQFRGEVAIIADKGLPSRTVYSVLYTCGQAGFSDFRLLVLKGGASTSGAR